MIKTCLVVLSCITHGGVFAEFKQKPAYACAVNANAITKITYSEAYGAYNLNLTGKSYSEFIKETPSQVVEKVNNCK